MLVSEWVLVLERGEPEWGESRKHLDVKEEGDSDQLYIFLPGLRSSSRLCQRSWMGILA